MTVNITPESTRTYNSALAFDPAANFGNRDAVQVSVQSPSLVFTAEAATAWDGRRR